MPLFIVEVSISTEWYVEAESGEQLLNASRTSAFLDAFDDWRREEQPNVVISYSAPSEEVLRTDKVEYVLVDGELVLSYDEAAKREHRRIYKLELEERQKAFDNLTLPLFLEED